MLSVAGTNGAYDWSASAGGLLAFDGGADDECGADSSPASGCDVVADCGSAIGAAMPVGSFARSRMGAAADVMTSTILCSAKNGLAALSAFFSSFRCTSGGSSNFNTTGSGECGASGEDSGASTGSIAVGFVPSSASGVVGKDSVSTWSSSSIGSAGGEGESRCGGPPPLAGSLMLCGSEYANESGGCRPKRTAGRVRAEQRQQAARKSPLSRHVSRSTQPIGDARLPFRAGDARPPPSSSNLALEDDEDKRAPPPRTDETVRRRVGAARARFSPDCVDRVRLVVSSVAGELCGRSLGCWLAGRFHPSDARTNNATSRRTQQKATAHQVRRQVSRVVGVGQMAGCSGASSRRAFTVVPSSARSSRDLTTQCSSSRSAASVHRPAVGSALALTVCHGRALVTAL
jgi:hypothetical protein